MYTPMHNLYASQRGLLPYISKPKPGSLHLNPVSSRGEGDPLARHISKSSKASSGEPSRSSQEAQPLEPVRPADDTDAAAGVGRKKQQQHHKQADKDKDKPEQHRQRKIQRRSKKKSKDAGGSEKEPPPQQNKTTRGSIDEEEQDEEHHGGQLQHRLTATPSTRTARTSSSTASSSRNNYNNWYTTAAEGATPPHHTEPLHQHNHQKHPSSSASPLSSSSAASPKLAQQGAFTRASHSISSRGKHHHDSQTARLSSDTTRQAHGAHGGQHKHPSSPRSPAAPQMTQIPVIPFGFFSAPEGVVLSSSSHQYHQHHHHHNNNSTTGNMMSSATDASSSSRENLITSKPFVLRNGRSYLNDTSLPYPLPADLTELHRQSMRTLLLIQLFGSPVCSPVFTKRPPQRVLEIGCGSGFWSMMCHRYFKSRGHGNISFTGIDIAPLAPTGPTINAAGASGSINSGSSSSSSKPDPEMKWNFISHDLRQLPWPVESEAYDLVMVKDMSLATTNLQHQHFVDEYIRLLRPGGVLEIWESDHLIRMLRKHVPDAKLAGGEDTEDQAAATSLGAYVMNGKTPLSAPLNSFLIDYNQWLSRALEARDLTAVPCTLIGPTLLQESEALTDVRSRRMAIPLSEVRWEREGVGGGVVTKDGKPITAASRERAASTTTPRADSRVLSPGQEALRQTALLTVVQQVQALEPILREVSGKSQDEWDVWMGKMMGDLMSDSGTSWGECLEVGAWTATKRKS